VTSTTTSSPQLDAITSSAIQQALGLARSGRLKDACRVAEQALAGGGDRVSLNALLGMLRMDTGENELAIRHLEVAHAGRPTDLRIATNLATVLANAGEMERVLDVASRDLAFSDPTLQLARIRGYAAQMSERAEEAVDAYEHVVRSQPNDWESHNNLGNARLLSGLIPLQQRSTSREAIGWPGSSRRQKASFAKWRMTFRMIRSR
jgi:Flp pilus assembly protein TadD